MAELFDAYFVFFRSHGYALFYMIFAVISSIYTAVRVIEVIVDIVKIKRGHYDRPNRRN